MTLLQNIPVSLIHRAVKEDWIVTLAYWVWLKKTGTVYKYSVRQLSKILKLSPATCSRHVKVMLDKGLVFKSGGNLTCTGTNKLKPYYKDKNGKNHREEKVVKAPVVFNKGRQVAILRMYCIQTNLIKQGYIGNQKAEIIKIGRRQLRGRTGKLKRHTKNHIKLLRQYDTAEALQDSYDPKLRLSNIKVGQLIGRGQKTGQKLQQLLNKLGLLKVTQSFKRLCKMDYYTFLMFRIKQECRKLVYDFKTGWVLLQKLNTYEIPTLDDGVLRGLVPADSSSRYKMKQH